MLVGYARVSTDDQDLSLQRDALTVAGCERLFTDSMSGAKAERPGLAEVLDFCRAGDTLVVWRLDRLGRSLTNLIELLNLLAEKEIGFKSLSEQIDTTTSGGKLVFHIFGALAEFERELIRERTWAGLAAARARDRHGGRPRKIASERQLKMAQALYQDGSHSIDDICRTLGISRATLYRVINPRTRQPRE
jgi:DNA invertase Pin-like site-specific DNA recombinase